MSTSLSEPEREDTVGRLARARLSFWLFWLAVALVLVAAVAMRFYQLNVPFDRDGYDEGVYWQSLRAMLAGQDLYYTIFYSQPPVFLLSIYPGFALLGGTLWSARAGVALVSLLGFPGVYMLGKALAGRTGALIGLLLLAANAFYLAESQTIQGEAPSVAFTLLALGCAFLWWQHPDGRRGIILATLTGIALVLSILSKLLCITTLVPIACLLLARIWQIWRGQPGTKRASWYPILAGIGGALLTVLLVLAPFFGSWADFWAGVVSFHQAAGVSQVNIVENNNGWLIELALLTPLSVVALYGVVSACWRKDWRVLPLLIWLLVTLVTLWLYHPLLFHHTISLEPPLLALTLLGVEPFAAWRKSFRPMRRLWTRQGVALALILVAVALAVQQDVFYYAAASTYTVNTVTLQDVFYTPLTLKDPGPEVAQDSPLAARVAADLARAITPDQWVVTDGQFIAGLANRSVPPELVDTSTVRIDTGSVTLAGLEQAALNPRVHAVLFATGRFSSDAHLVGFHAWVAAHYHLLHSYSQGIELWVR
jgi:4-amino-4-deoxy-L-arabinose transferase-like glycosyltransferase